MSVNGHIFRKPMRRTLLTLPLLLLCHCARVPDAAIPRPEPTTSPSTRPALATTPARPSTPLESARVTRSTINSITFEGIAFDSRSHRLVVVDQAGGPGSQFPDAASAARSMAGLAAANAGFFTPAGAPLGLVVSAGKRSGSWNSSSSLGSGVWHESSSGSPAISRREALGKPAASAMHELIQAGPMLIANQRPVSGLDPAKHSVRTLMLWDGGTRWWLGQSSSCSLANLGAALSSGQPSGWPVSQALNLDGGRSSDLWISGNVEGGPVLKRAIWNRPVRNFLVLTPR